MTSCRPCRLSPALFASLIAVVAASSASARTFIPLTNPAPPKPVWWAMNDGATESVCYNFDDMMMPPTPSELAFPPGLPPPTWKDSGDMEIRPDGRMYARQNPFPEPPVNFQYAQVNITDVTMPPDYKEIFLSVDIFHNGPPPAATIAALVIPNAAFGTSIDVIAAGATDLMDPSWTQSLRISALIRVWPCPPTYFFGVFLPPDNTPMDASDDWAMDNLCIGGRCFSGPCDPAAFKDEVQFNLNAPPDGAPGYQCIPAPMSASMLLAFGVMIRARRRSTM